MIDTDWHLIKNTFRLHLLHISNLVYKLSACWILRSVSVAEGVKDQSTWFCIIVAITCEEQTWWGNTKSPTKKEKHSAAARVWCVWGSNSHFSPLLSVIRNHCAFHSTTTLGYIWKVWKCFWHILPQQINSESLLVLKLLFLCPVLLCCICMFAMKVMWAKRLQDSLYLG